MENEKTRKQQYNRLKPLMKRATILQKIYFALFRLFSFVPSTILVTSKIFSRTKLSFWTIENSNRSSRWADFPLENIIHRSCYQIYILHILHITHITYYTYYTGRWGRWGRWDQISENNPAKTPKFFPLSSLYTPNSRKLIPAKS